MNVVIGLVVSLVGLGAVLLNKRLGDAFVDTTNSSLGYDSQRESGGLTRAWSRAVAMIIGVGMVSGGIYFVYVSLT